MIKKHILRFANINNKPRIFVAYYLYYTPKSKTTFFITVKDYKLFYELRDGHTVSPRYYDVNGHVGFSAIIFLEGK